MLDQLAIGMGLTIACILISGFGFWMMETLFRRHRDWLMGPRHYLKLFAVVVGAGGAILLVLLAGVFVWAGAFTGFGMFADLETAFYYALVSYTTVGYGDVQPAGEWRILGAMAAANGFINIGLLTTLMIRGLHYVREGYRKSLDDDGDEEGGD